MLPCENLFSFNCFIAFALHILAHLPFKPAFVGFFSLETNEEKGRRQASLFGTYRIGTTSSNIQNHFKTNHTK